MKRAVPRFAGLLFAFFLLMVVAMIAVDLLSEPPSLAALHATPVVLEAAVEKVTPSGRGSRGPYAEIRASGRLLKVMNLCFLSDCAIPAPLAALKPGDHVDLWIDRDVVWQAGHGAARLLSYDATVKAFRAAVRRRLLVTVPMGLLLAAVGVAGLWVRHKRAAGAKDYRITIGWKDRR